MPAHTDLITEQPRPGATVVSPPVGPLDPYVPSVAKPWNARRVAHLYRRLGFGATLDQIQQGLLMSPSDLVDQLLDNAANLTQPPAPAWANEPQNPGNAIVEEQRRSMRHLWLEGMLGEGVRAKMAFFWHNHFVTKLLVYGCNAYLWSYYDLLHRYAFGNFREFTLEMGKNPAMLVFLNGNVNVVGEPNENYARELMELFTMGEGNGYTQADVVEMARALTGWTASFNDCTPPAFDPARFDNNPKTIFGKTDNFNFDSAHYLIFSERAEEVSRFVTGKIYKHFLYPTTFYPVIEGLAQTFRDNNWELLPVYKQLFKSEHFFDEQFFSSKIKSPMDVLLPLLKSAGAKYPDHVKPEWWDDISFYAQRLGQELFGPPNVAGWKEHRTWVNESTLTGRWNYAALITQFLQQNDQLKDNLRTIAKTLTNNSKDPAVITAALTEFYLRQELDAVQQQAAVLYFKSSIPENYFTNGTWNLDWDEAPGQIINLLIFLAKLPEFQLT